MNNENKWKELAGRLESLFKKKDKKPEIADLRDLIKNQEPTDIAMALDELETEQAITAFTAIEKPVARQVIPKINAELAKKILKKLQPGELADLVKDLDPKLAAAVVTEAPKKEVESFLNDQLSHPTAARDVEYRIEFRKNAAGRMMTTQFVRLYPDTTVKDALKVISHTNPEVDIPEDLFVVNRVVNEKKMRNELLGVISIRDLLMHEPEKKIEDIMAKEVVTVSAETSQTDAAALLSKYRFQTLPVVDKENYLIGVIAVDDLLHVIVDRLRNLYTKAVGTDAQKMAKLSPWQEAKLRVPWLLGTMVIELCAGMVISHYDDILQKVILLASFMPVISAISGNVGLQAAAITVRAVDTKNAQSKSTWASVKKEIATSLLMAAICGTVLGGVGAVWANHIPFGMVIGGALTCSMLTAGLMGTVIPIVSKRLGFDPATTAGPFETALQDIVGFGVFLWLATVMQHWIT